MKCEKKVKISKTALLSRFVVKRPLQKMLDFDQRILAEKMEQIVLPTESLGHFGLYLLRHRTKIDKKHQNF